MTAYVNFSQVGIGLRMTMPISAPNNRSIWKRDIRMSRYRNLETAEESVTKSTNTGLAQFLAKVNGDFEMLKAKSSVSFIAKEIGLTLFSFLLRPEEELDITQPMGSVGVDSLVSIELRNWFQREMGIDISVLEILNAASLEDLGNMAAKKLMANFGGATHDGESFLLMKAP
jgi:acyl carrier protein